MTVLDTLTLALGVDPKGIDTGLAQAKQKIDAGAKSMAQGLMTPLKAALGAVAAGLSLGAITNQYLNQADAIGKMADSIGADIEELQAWGEAATRAGGSAEAFNGSITTLNKMLQMTAATGKGPAVMALEQFGIKAKDASGKARDTFEILRDIAGKMEGMDKQKAIGFGQKLGLDRGTIMLLQSGRAAVEDLITEMKDLGLYTKEDQEIAGKANNAIAKLGLALKSGAAIIMRQVVPAITWVTEKAIKVVQFLKKNQPFVTAGLGLIASVLTAMLVPALMKVAAAQAKAWAPFYVLGAIIAGIALVIDDFWAYMNGGNSALEDLWKTFGEGPELLAKFKKAWEDVKTTFLQVFQSAKEKALDFFSYFDGVLPPLITLFEGVGNIIKGLFKWDFKTLGKGLSQALMGAVEAITEAFSGLWKYISDGIGNISWEGIKTKAKAAWDAVKETAIGFFENLPKDAQDKLVRLWETITNALNFDELKKSFAKIFDFEFDWQKIKDAIVKGFEQAWEWIKANFPPARWLAGFGEDAQKAEADNQQRNEQETNPDNYGAGNYSSPQEVIAAATAARPTPADGVSSQAAAAPQTTTNNLTQTDSRTVSVTINAPNGDPQALGNAAAKALDKRPAWMAQAAVGNAVAGAN